MTKKAKETTSQFFGEKEVKSITGNTATLTDGSKIELTDKQLGYIITETPHDLDQFRSLVAAAVAQDMLQIIEDHNVRFGDIDYIIKIFVESYNRGFNIALGKAFGTYEQGRHPDYFKEDITVAHIKKFLDLKE